MKKTKQKKPILKKKTCVECQRAFTPNHPANKTCSDKCKDKHRMEYVLPVNKKKKDHVKNAKPQPSLHEDCVLKVLELNGIIAEKNEKIDRLRVTIMDLQKNLNSVIVNSTNFNEMQKQNECILQYQIKTLQCIETITHAVTILLEVKEKESKLNESPAIQALHQEHEYYTKKSEQNWLKKLFGGK